MGFGENEIRNELEEPAPDGEMRVGVLKIMELQVQRMFQNLLAFLALSLAGSSNLSAKMGERQETKNGSISRSK